ncbi:hypothetical protein K443DRAFT_541091 [Laccaria amethystina LaAM-08-1]|uniref:Uncharacterized protein n=1 Tax=Laccaria amethystina LaAM-08-1 TaxID=1095629 RepID=A0A0C9WH40_9AGAR|nr:hypothetical protein K443DRAFT_541091 [Laccaria amethystina LaAM-08-1]
MLRKHDDAARRRSPPDVLHHLTVTTLYNVVTVCIRFHPCQHHNTITTTTTRHLYDGTPPWQGRDAAARMIKGRQTTTSFIIFVNLISFFDMSLRCHVAHSAIAPR